MIPRTIHSIWFQGEQVIPAKYQADRAALRAMNPGWAYKLWDDTSLQAACREFDRVYPGSESWAKYVGFELMHQKIDFGRYVVLALYGGMSIDMDVVPIRPLDATPGLDHDGVQVIVSGVPLRHSFEEYMFTFGEMTGLYNNAMILAVPRAALMVQLVRDVIATPPSDAFLVVNRIQWTTGPLTFTRSLKRSQSQSRDDKALLVLDNKYFEPCFGGDVHCALPPDAILYHNHAQTWVPAWIVNAGWLYYALKPFLLPVVVLAAFVWWSRARSRA